MSSVQLWKQNTANEIGFFRTLLGSNALVFGHFPGAQNANSVKEWHGLRSPCMVSVLSDKTIHQDSLLSSSN